MSTLGWSTWFTSELRTASSRSEVDDAWSAGRPAVASCPDSGHEAPAPECFCGWEAVAEPGDGLLPGDILALVELSGRVFHDHGTGRIRAAKVRPRFLIVGERVPQNVEQSIAERYGVPVHRTRIPVTRLARYLGERPDLADALKRGPDPAAVAAFADRLSWWDARWAVEKREEQAANTAQRQALRSMRREGTLRGAALRAFVLLTVLPAGLAALFAWMMRSHLEEQATAWDQLLIAAAVTIVSAFPTGALMVTVDALTSEEPIFGSKTLLALCSGAGCILTVRWVAYGPEPTTWFLLATTGVTAALLAIVVHYASRTDN